MHKLSRGQSAWWSAGGPGILALLICSLLASCSSPSAVATTPSSVEAGGSPSAAGPSPAASSSVRGTAAPSAAVSSRPSAAGFPLEIAGLTVITVAEANHLLGSGELNGHAVAVAGYFSQFIPSCPYPGRYIGPLEIWCRFDAFADSPDGARLCRPEGSNGMSCSQPSGTHLSPFFMPETSGSPWSFASGGALAEPTAMVVVGHAGDARQWKCTAATQGQCASAFVVDRIAWADGGDLPIAAPQTGDQRMGTPITPKMTLAQAAVVAGLSEDLLTGGAFRRGDLNTIDPRWSFAGDDIVWLLRSIGAGTGETRPERVWLVDDATGTVIDSHPLQLAAEYQPARLWEMATTHGVECCLGDVLAFYRVASEGGTSVSEGMVPGGSSGGTDSTTFGGSYGGDPIVLTAGRYTISAWLAPNNRGVIGTPRGQCSTHLTLQPLDNVVMNAVFPSGKACTFGPAPSGSPT